MTSNISDQGLLFLELLSQLKICSFWNFLGIDSRVRLHQQSSPAVLELEVETVGVPLEVVSPRLYEESLLHLERVRRYNTVDLVRPDH